MAIGKLMTAVVDVDDLDAGEAFWSELTGLPIIPSIFPGRYSYLGQQDPWQQELILHLTKSRKADETNRGHVDIWVRDVDLAISQVEAIGGRLKKAPAIYPRPGSYGDEPARLDWAVMQDPFKNEFCLITVLSAEQAASVREASTAGSGDDHHWRVAAGVTSAP